MSAHESCDLSQAEMKIYNCCYKMGKLSFFLSKWSDLKKIFILWENSYPSVNLHSFSLELILSQLEINHVSHKPTARN